MRLLLDTGTESSDNKREEGLAHIYRERKKEQIKPLVLQSSPFYTTSDRQWRALRVESAMQCIAQAQAVTHHSIHFRLT